MQTPRVPIFYDTTLRDGNQSLKKPWNIAEKELIFKQLLQLNIPAFEIGFPASNEMEYQACQRLAKQAPNNTTICVFARAKNTDIQKAVEVLKNIAHPRIQIALPFNLTGLQYVLKKDIHEATNTAIQAIKYAKSLLPAYGEIAFGIEHFGDCSENFSEVLVAIREIVDAGASVINLANTVERTRPFEFTSMVKQVSDLVKDKALISVHCHNDLGMATATTVESFFQGATQLETTINGIGERCGNTNMFEVAMALYNAGIPTGLNMQKFCDIAHFLSKMANIPIYEKAPLIGKDCFLHRSGMHQDGANKTKSLIHRQYLPYSPELIGRTEGEQVAFTSQSGKTALQILCQKIGYQLNPEQVEQLMPEAKKLASIKGELSLIDLSQLCHNAPFTPAKRT